MPNFRRRRVAGGCFFFTLVTFQRRRLFVHPTINAMLLQSMAAEQRRRVFVIDALVILPDHLHMIMRLPTGDFDFSTRIGKFKERFSRQYLSTGGEDREVTQSQRQRRRRGIWQPRFWEHQIRSGEDYEAYLTYIHLNPIKHEYVKCAHAWTWTSFHHFVRRRLLQPNWGCNCGIVPGRVIKFPDLDVPD